MLHMAVSRNKINRDLAGTNAFIALCSCKAVKLPDALMVKVRGKALSFLTVSNERAMCINSQ